MEAVNDAAGIAEVLLLAMDGDFLPGAGMGCDNDGQDVPLDKATPKEVAWWAARTLTATDDDPDRIARAYLEALRRTGPSPKLLAVIDQQLHDLDDVAAEFGVDLDDDETCHCGRPVSYGFDGDYTHHRGMCHDCDATRCDAYPMECPYPRLGKP